MPTREPAPNLAITLIIGPVLQGRAANEQRTRTVTMRCSPPSDCIEWLDNIKMKTGKL